MGNRLRALSAACLVAGSAVALAAAPAAAANTGTLRLTGWFDTNKNGKQDNGEKPIANFTEVSVRTESAGTEYPVKPGQRSLILPTGKYLVELPGYLPTGKTPFHVTVPAGGTVTETFSVLGRTFHGVAWRDANVDGIRQDNEPRQAGVRVYSTQGSTVTDARGNYTLHNVPTTHGVRVDRKLNGKPLALSPSQQGYGEFAGDADSPVDTDFADRQFTTPDMNSFPENPEQIVRHADLGIAPGTAEQSISVHSKQNWNAIRIGRKFDVSVTVRANSGVPTARALEVVNSGTDLKILAVNGAGWTPETRKAKDVYRFHPDRGLVAGRTHTVTLTMRADSDHSLEPVVTFRLADTDSSGYDGIDKYYGIAR